MSFCLCWLEVGTVLNHSSSCSSGDPFTLHQPLPYRGLIFKPSFHIMPYNYYSQSSAKWWLLHLQPVALCSVKPTVIKVSDSTGLTTRSSWECNLGTRIQNMALTREGCRSHSMQRMEVWMLVMKYVYACSADTETCIQNCSLSSASWRAGARAGSLPWRHEAVLHSYRNQVFHYWALKNIRKPSFMVRTQH